MFVLLFSRLLYDLIGGDSNYPSESTVRGWIAKLNEAIHCGLRYTEHLAKVLTNRANHVRWKLRKDFENALTFKIIIIVRSWRHMTGGDHLVLIEHCI